MHKMKQIPFWFSFTNNFSLINSQWWFPSSRGLSVGIYVINSPEVCQFILENSKSNIVVVENDELLQKILKVTGIYYIMWFSNCML